MANNNLTQPSLYSGTQKVATQQNLNELKNNILNILTGPKEQLGLSGYIPWKFKSDGTLDIEKLFPQLINFIKSYNGLTITNNGDFVLSGVNQIDFSGNYVYLSTDESGKLFVNIRQPKTQISRFNTKDGITDARVFIENEIIKNGIIPFPTAQSTIYGDWQAGSKHDVINWNGNVADQLALTIKQKTFSTKNNSFFKVFVYDEFKNQKTSFISQKIVPQNNISFQLNGKQGLNNSQFISVFINQFEQKEDKYQFIPLFKINLYQIFAHFGNRFSIKIVHCDNEKEYTYQSDQMLFNVGTMPQINSSQLSIKTNQLTGDIPTYINCSGLRYLTNGKLKFNVVSVQNLNKLAAIQKKLELLIDDAKFYPSSTISNYTYYQDAMPSFESQFELKDDLFINGHISGKLIASNAFGKTQQTTLGQLLYNSKISQNQTNNLSEFFNNELQRVKNDFQVQYIGGSSGVLKQWDSSASLRTFDNGTGLMVIPTKGLQYPYGNWSNFVPVNQPDYEDVSFRSTQKYFSRVFTSSNSKTKFGGIFKFVGLSKQKFLSSNVSCIISNDNGNSWLSLKHQRGLSVVIQQNGILLNCVGILTNIVEKDDALYVYWAYPTQKSSANKIYFKFGLTQFADCIIKEISLLNLNGSKEW